jgi:hypothetical protein
MNADKRRWNESLGSSAFIGFHRRPEYRPSEFSSRPATDGQDRTPGFPNVMFHLVCGITPQPMFKTPQRMT